MAPVGDSLTIYTLVLFGMDMVLSGIYRKGGNIDLRDVCRSPACECPGSEGGGHC